LKCYVGKVLRVNLTQKEVSIEDLNLDYAKEYIGGRGLGLRMLMDEIDPGVDPLSAENKMIFISGPLSGTRVSTGCRYMVVTKSPLNNMIARSNSGGVWGAMLKYAGFDAIIVEGKAAAPVYLTIEDGKVEIKDATHLWGKTTEETAEALGSGKDTSVLNIGPAGENLSLLASVMNDVDRAAGRSGVGAVMGSKNLKAIVAKSKNKQIPTFDEEEFKVAALDAAKKIKEHGVTGEGLPTYGTAILVNIINSVGSYPYKNFQFGEDPDADMTSGETLITQDNWKGNTFCHRCTIGCGRGITRNGSKIGGPEYETIWGFAADCGVNDIQAVIEANHQCNEMGVDTISMACTIAAAMELYQRGYIKDEDCAGVPLAWGNSEAVYEWVKKVGRNDGKLATLMAQGSYRLCEHYGVPEYSMSVKKLDLPAYDPRGIQGIGLNYATSNRGGCHVNGYTISPEILGVPIEADRKVTEGKAELVKIFQDLTAVIDSAGLCLFTSFALGAPEYAALLSAAMGVEFTAEAAMEAGERIYNLERVFNKKAGMKAEDDTLPKRFFDEPLQTEASKGMVSKLDVMLPEYYKLRGWKDGFPTKETLERLGL
jgi:aldehyde:ferredoxin oxidoreductase